MNSRGLAPRPSSVRWTLREGCRMKGVVESASLPKDALDYPHRRPRPTPVFEKYLKNRHLTIIIFSIIVVCFLIIILIIAAE